MNLVFLLCRLAVLVSKQWCWAPVECFEGAEVCQVGRRHQLCLPFGHNYSLKNQSEERTKVGFNELARFGYLGTDEKGWDFIKAHAQVSDWGSTVVCVGDR